MKTLNGHMNTVSLSDAFTWQTKELLDVLWESINSDLKYRRFDTLNSNVPSYPPEKIPDWIVVASSDSKPLQRALAIYTAQLKAIYRQPLAIPQPAAVAQKPKPTPSLSIFGIPIIPLSIAPQVKSKPNAYQPMNMDIDMKSNGGNSRTYLRHYQRPCQYSRPHGIFQPRRIAHIFPKPSFILR